MQKANNVKCSKGYINMLVGDKGELKLKIMDLESEIKELKKKDKPRQSKEFLKWIESEIKRLKRLREESPSCFNLCSDIISVHKNIQLKYLETHAENTIKGELCLI